MYWNVVLLSSVIISGYINWIGCTFIYTAVTVSMYSKFLTYKVGYTARSRAHSYTILHKYSLFLFVCLLAYIFFSNIIIMKNSTKTHRILIHDMSFRLRSYFFFFFLFILFIVVFIILIFFFSSSSMCVFILFRWNGTVCVHCMWMYYYMYFVKPNLRL